MTAHTITYAFIDSQNLHMGVKELGWKLDYLRFRTYLRDKYHVDKAFIFIGYLPENVKLYSFLQEAGYICIFRPTLTKKDGEVKGNCDAELVLHTMIQFDNYKKALIVSGDGDFQCLAEYLLEKNKLGAILVPNQKKYSALLKFKAYRPYLRFISDLEHKLAYTREKKSPRKDGTLKGKSSTGDVLILPKNNKEVNPNKKHTRRSS